MFGLMVTIYFLYMKYTKGIYLAKIAATSAMVAYFATYYWRHDTVDYGLQGVIGLFLVVMLFLPVIEMVLMGEDSSSLSL